MSFEYTEIINQLKTRYSPEMVYLFGSQAKGNATRNSDIDLCVVMPAEDKRHTVADIYYNIESKTPFDVLLYTPDEWEHCVRDKASFAHKIATEGVLIYGRQQKIF